MGHESSAHMRDVNNRIKRLNEFITKLEEASEKLSIAIKGWDGAQEIEELIREDWDYISTVMNLWPFKNWNKDHQQIMHYRLR